MNEIKRYEFEGHALMFQPRDGEWWASGDDIADALGYRPMRVTELYATDGPVLHEPTLLEIDALEMRREVQARARREERARPPDPPDGAHAAA